jgi:pyridoxal phosphate enzyme (YggS family)
MTDNDIIANVEKIKKELEKGNCLGEKVTILAATKTQTANDINAALKAGINDIGENKTDEFNEKYDSVLPCNHHFIGHLQTNKIKYLIGKTFLYQSIDRYELADELDKRSEKANIVSDILIQINIGKEETKGGFYIEEAEKAYNTIKSFNNLKIRGFMAMLPISQDESYLKNLCLQMRTLYDRIKKDDKDIVYLSMGMSGDWKLCVSCGSNMIRLGTAIFGSRNYNI